MVVTKTSRGEMAKKPRSIVLRVPERTLALLERIAEREHITLKAFLEQRVAEIANYVANRKAATPETDSPDEPEESGPGQYL